MKTEPAFDMGTPAYSVHRLFPEDSQAIQELFEKCLDFMLLVDGHPAGPHAAEEELCDVPPGKSLDDKFVFGIVNLQNDLVGYLDVLRDYPDETTWWIGLLLIVPEIRSQGMGQKIVRGFADYVLANEGQTIMLGVVEENKLAYRFWERMGFEFVHTTEPRKFGEKIQRVNVMRRRLPGAIR
jgi:RimJ/RimL family protein N-acetyltransferase